MIGRNRRRSRYVENDGSAESITSLALLPKPVLYCLSAQTEFYLPSLHSACVCGCCPARHLHTRLRYSVLLLTKNKVTASHSNHSTRPHCCVPGIAFAAGNRNILSDITCQVMQLVPYSRNRHRHSFYTGAFLLFFRMRFYSQAAVAPARQALQKTMQQINASRMPPAALSGSHPR